MASTKLVYTRYAPSPTGKFHIGGARTAVFNYLFAKKNHGFFILRIEDTDIERNVDDGINSQIDNLKWLGIYPDESFQNPGASGPYMQSQKLQQYSEIAQKLILEKKAYYCFCTAEELEEHRKNASENHLTPKYSRKCAGLSNEEVESKLNEKIPYVVRIKINEQKDYKWKDLIRKEPIVYPGSSLSDIVILKSNNYPTYNFAVVVDDMDMHITHVLRGEEHIANTPYQLAIYEALNAKQIPEFAHLSIIINEHGQKLSKRDESMNQFIENYKENGYPPEAIVNFLALLGWSNPSNKEILPLNKIISAFSLENISTSPSFFDEKKLKWISAIYIKTMSDQVYLAFVNPFFDIDLGDLNSQKDEIALMYKNQISYAKELNTLAFEMFDTNLKFEDIFKKNIDFFQQNVDVIEIAIKLLPASEEEWDHSSIRAYLKQIISQTGKQGPNFFMPMRYALTHKKEGPELFKIIKILGRSLCQKRLLYAWNLIKDHGKY